MEISEGQLRRMVREVDDVHREGMSTFAEDNRELVFGELRTGRAGTSRRRFLAGAAGGGGALLSVGGVEARHQAILAMFIDGGDPNPYAFQPVDAAAGEEFFV
jgi:hypothetical protein